MDLFGLDVETRAIDPRCAKYGALEPWRLRHGDAEISSMAVCRPDNTVIQIVNDKAQHLWEREVVELLRSLKGKRVFCHNALFDVAWVIATVQPFKFRSLPKEVTDIQWADTMLLVKWLVNGQLAEDSKFSYSLANLVETFLPDHPSTKDFVEMKKQPFVAGENAEYWESRGKLDVLMTRALAEKMMPLVPESMRVGLMTEWSCIVPVANSWINGIKIATEEIDSVEQMLMSKMDAATDHLGVMGPVINSPKQLGNLLFNEWGLTPWSYTPTKTPSTSGDDLMWIQYELKGVDPDMATKLGSIIDYKSHKTLKSKYIDTLKDALEYTGDGYIYGIPKLFGTYTSRMTYANSTVKDGPKVSIALHQLPRVKDKNAEVVKAIRSLLTAPEGFGVLEVDASGQESRLMAIRSGDPTMLDIFRRSLNFHSMTAAAIIGTDYNNFQEKYLASKSGYFVEQRQLGKLTNLSCNYRIGGRNLANKAFTEYDTYMTEATGRFLVNTFARQYPGVPAYWSDVIRSSKENGYTECYGGKRYKLSKWDEKSRWINESSAINFPIQGSGGSMKEIMISVLAKKMPETLLSLDLHDATFNFAKLDHLKETEEAMVECLNSIDYSSFWGFDLPIPLPYESASGRSFGDVK
jgi:DNA polymerase I-like protein with 3'-5' exonuclease and polymerase domains